MNVEAFAIIVALIIVTTRMTLSFMENKDLARGLPVNHREYTFSGILGIMTTERLDRWKAKWKKRFRALKNSFRKLFAFLGRKTHADKSKSEGTGNNN